MLRRNSKRMESTTTDQFQVDSVFLYINIEATLLAGQLSSNVPQRKMARLLFHLIPTLLAIVGVCRAEGKNENLKRCNQSLNFQLKIGWFEDGQEYTYSYLAYTITGVRDPVDSGSSFGISGNLVIQKQTGQAIIKVIFIKTSI